MSEPEIQDVFCDPGKISQYFVLHSTVSAAELSSALCGLNGTMFVEEFMKTFSIDKLMEEMNGASGESIPLCSYSDD